VAPPFSAARHRDLALTLLVAIAGGALAHLAGLPLAWMIGAMLAVAGAGFAGLVAPPLAIGRTGALLVLGVALGQTFTLPVLRVVSSSLPALVLGGAAAIAAGAIAGRATRRLAGIDARTAYFCAVPGGIVVMAVLAAQAGADVAAVTLSQTLRMALVVLTYPPALALAGARGDELFVAAALPLHLPGLALIMAAALAGALLLRRLGMANPWMLGPLAVSVGFTASGHVPSGVPGALIDAAQVLMGAALGARLSPGFLRRARRLVLASLASVLIVAVLLVLAGLALAHGFALPPASVILGLAPGGMPEMAITAKVMRLGVPLVLAFHLVRTLMCNILVLPLWRLIDLKP
jgi:hypothetical protein